MSTKIFPAWKSKPEAVVYNGATMVLVRYGIEVKIRNLSKLWTLVKDIGEYQRLFRGYVE